jgi:hypothetical protein
LVIVLIWALIVGPLLLRFVIFHPADTPAWGVTLIFGLGLHRVHVFAVGVAIWLLAQGRLRSLHRRVAADDAGGAPRASPADRAAGTNTPRARVSAAGERALEDLVEHPSQGMAPVSVGGAP